ncbi:MAG: hypothetical protein KDB28_08760, partial [Tetrasphaera sp.]|nr:hypothetical protein [Tetrasphaera sp.]
LDLGFARRAGCLALRTDDPFDRRQELFAHRVVVGAEAILKIPIPAPARSAGRLVNAASVAGVAKKARPSPKQAYAVTASHLYCESKRLVGMSKAPQGPPTARPRSSACAAHRGAAIARPRE